MTSSSRWMFLGMLALANIVASVPPPLITDACSLICNPGAETEEDRLRDPNVFARIPKASCEIQSGDDHDQARIIMRHCLKLCSFDLTVDSVANCAAMLSTFAAEYACYCEALSPLSPNTHRLGEQWRIDALVEYISQDLFDKIFKTQLDILILCDIFNEKFPSKAKLQPGRIINKCKEIENQTLQLHQSRQKRDTSRQENLDTTQQEELSKILNFQQSDITVDDGSDTDYLKRMSQDIGLNTETVFTSQAPDRKLKPGDEVYDLEINRKSAQSVYKKSVVIDVADISTSQEIELENKSREEIEKILGMKKENEGNSRMKMPNNNKK